MSSLWLGPYTVVDKTSPANYLIQLVGGTLNFIVHHNRLKLCFEEPWTDYAASVHIEDRVAGYTSVATNTGDQNNRVVPRYPGCDRQPPD